MTTTEVSSAPAVSRPSSRKPFARPGAPLSRLERRVLILIAEGMTDRQIADEIHVQYDTQKTLAKRIYAKLRATNRAQAVNQGWARGLLGPRPIAPGTELGYLGDLIDKHGGPVEWEALTTVCARLNAGDQARSALDKLKSPPPAWLHVTPAAVGNTSRVAGA